MTDELIRQASASVRTDRLTKIVCALIRNSSTVATGAQIEQHISVAKEILNAIEKAAQ